MRPNPELNYWLEVNSVDEAKSKILVGGNWEERTKKDMNLIVNKLGISKKDKVLDFGCGIGRLVKEVAPLCNKILGMDVSEPMIRYAHKYVYKMKNVLLTTMQEEATLTLQDKQVDKIYSFLVLQHIEKPKAHRILMEFNRVLKKFGKVLLQYPNVLNKNFYFTQMRHRYQLGAMAPLIEFYSKEEIEMIFEVTGFEIIELIDDGEDFYVVAEKVRDHITYNPIAVSPVRK